MNIKNKKIFIAGHNGMVGGSLLKLLKKKGFKKLIYANRNKLDLTDYLKVQTFIKRNKPEFIINCAGKVGGILANSSDPLTFLVVNLDIQLNLIKSCKINNIKNFINLGSSCIYPKFAKQPLQENSLLDGKLEKTNEGYALAKIAGLKACEYFNKKFNKNYLTLMPCNLYGPNDEFDLDKSHFIPALINKFHRSITSKKKIVEIWGSGDAKREVMYVDDLSDAILFFMNKIYKKNKKFLKFIRENSFINIGTGVDLSIKNYSKLIKKIINPKCKIVFNRSYPDGTPRKLLDNTNSKNFGWKAKTNLYDGIVKTYNWAKNSGKI